MLKRILIQITLLLAVSAAFAGDIATFVNLGFSDDSAYFMFGQYGIDQPGGASYAEIYAVDNAKNVFAPNGVLKTLSTASLDIGQDGSGLFFNLLYENAAAARRYRIDHLKQGRLLYVLLDGEEPKNELVFRDFKTKAEYGISLSQTSRGEGPAISSSFSLEVSVTDPEGRIRCVQAGSPELRRSGVSDYLIRRAILSPDGRYLLIIIEKRLVAPEGKSIRYMVEPVKLR